MNTRTRYPAWLLLASAAVTSAFGQAVTSTPAASADVAEETIQLSPFLVSSERDTGYQAQSTLAGSRLSTPLKDLGAAISVYTKDFMTDIGATNANDLLVFATGMEASGSQANFSGANADIGSSEVLGDGPRTNPQSGSRSRGLNAPSFTRNYFLTSIAIDGYNTGSVTVNRGPNSILFGVGEPAGTVDNSLVTANLNRTTAKVEYRVGDNSSNRFVLDVNGVLIPKKLAVRVIGLDDQENYDQRPAFENKSRLFGNLKFTPYRSTILNANFETGKTRANRPITVLPFDSINKYWLAAGRPGYDWTFLDDLTRNPLAASQNTNNAALWPVGTGRAQVFGSIVIPYPNLTPGDGPQRSYRTSFNGTNNATNPGANVIRQQVFHEVVNRDLGNDTIQTAETFNIGEGGLSSALFPGGVKPAGLKLQGFTNYDAFPFNKLQIDETSVQNDDFRTFNVNLSQTVWADSRGVDRVGVELAYNSEYYTSFSNNASFSQGNGNHIRVDVNEYLPYGDGIVNGVATGDINRGKPLRNPNFGRPYVYGSSAAQLNYRETERETVRATAFIRHDFNETFGGRLGKWLGRHTLTGLYESYDLKDLPSSTRLRMFGAAADGISPAIGNFNRLPNAFIYLGDSIMDGRALTLKPIQIKPLVGGQTTNTAWFSAPAGLVNGVLTQGVIANTESTVTEGINSASARGEQIRSNAFILHSYWAMDHIITTVGWRKDRDYLKRFAQRSLATDPLANRLYLNDFNWPSKATSTTDPTESQTTGETLSYGGVVRWPQKLIRLPAGTDVSVFFNQSENFTPDGGRLNGLGLKLAPPSGETSEYGFSVSLMDDKLNLRVNRFETSQKNAAINPGNPTAAYNNSINGHYRQVTTFWVGQVNETPQFDRSASIAELLNALPNMKPLVNFQKVVGTDGRVSGTTDGLPTYYDTQDFVSKGTELELTYNPTRQWRIALNAAKQEVVKSNLAPGAKAVIAALMPIWQKNFDTPRDPTDLWQGPSVPFVSTTNNYGAILTREVLIPHATLIAQEGVASAEQRKYRANLVTNYTFGRESFLKGFGVGSGVRWQGKFALGYPTTFRPNGSVFVDIANPYWSGDDWNVDGWVSYTRKIYNDKVNWRVQLNARNIAGSQDPIAITVQPDGSPATTRIPPETRFYLTNTFEF